MDDRSCSISGLVAIRYNMEAIHCSTNALSWKSTLCPVSLQESTSYQQQRLRPWPLRVESSLCSISSRCLPECRLRSATRLDAVAGEPSQLWTSDDDDDGEPHARVKLLQDGVGPNKTLLEAQAKVCTGPTQTRPLDEAQARKVLTTILQSGKPLPCLVLSPI